MSGRRNSLQLFDGCDSCLVCRVPTHPHFQIEAESLVILEVQLRLSFLSLGNREERLPWSSGLPFVVEVLNSLRSDYFSSPSGTLCLQLRKLGTGIYCFSGLVFEFTRVLSHKYTLLCIEDDTVILSIKIVHQFHSVCLYVHSFEFLACT